MKRILILALFVFFGVSVFAQTKSSATVTITVTAPAPAVQLTAQSTSVQAGQTATVTASVTQAGVPATGSIDLCAKAPGTTSYVFVQSFPLVNGSAVCSYPLPASAPLGAYSVQAQFPSNGTCN